VGIDLDSRRPGCAGCLGGEHASSESLQHAVSITWA